MQWIILAFHAFSTVPKKKMNESELRKTEKLSGFLNLLLKLQIALYTIAVFVGYFQYHEYSNVPAHVDVTTDWLLSDSITAIVGLSQTVLAITLAVVFLKWIYRLNHNLRLLSAQRMKFTPGWSIGWYFIPIACLYKPYQAMKEIFKRANKDDQMESNILPLWWFLWITSAFAARLAMKMTLNSDGYDSLLASTVAYMVSDAIDVALAFVTLLLVQRIYRDYQKNYFEKDFAHNSDGSAIST